ncbi:MAG: CvpA family protein, partial [Oscillospiraceae bacterium]
MQNNLASYAPLLWDLGVVAVILGCALRARRKGFLTTVVELIGSLGGLAAALIYSGPVADRIYARFFASRVAEAVTQNIERFAEPGFDAFLSGLDAVLAQLPPMFSQAFGLQATQSVEQLYERAIARGGANLALSLAETVIAPLAVAVLQMAAFCLIFTFCRIAVGLLARLLRGVNHIPLLGSVNGLFGLLLGVAQGVLTVFVAAVALRMLMLWLGGDLPFLSAETLADTVLLKRLATAA